MAAAHAICGRTGWPQRTHGMFSPQIPRARSRCERARGWRDVSPVAAGIVLCLVVPLAFMMWAALQGFKSSIDVTVDETAKLSPGHRKWMRVLAFGGPLLIILGGVVGVVLRPAPNIFESELIGCSGAGAAWISAAWMTAIRARSQGSDGPRGS